MSGTPLASVMPVDDLSFEFEYSPGKIACGPGCVGEIGVELERRGVERALIVCGSTVGSTPAVVDPVRKGVGDRLVDVFAETTPEKRLATAVDGARLARRADVGALVALGGGSSLDVAKVIAALASHDRPPEDVAAESVEERSVPVASGGDPVPIVAVPTTLAGADLSVVGGVTLALDPEADGEAPYGSVSDRRLMPAALFYDPELFATTPKGVLTASAMNGFDKGVEALYTRNATPITDGTAMRGLRLLRSGLPALADDPIDDERLMEALAGTVLVQYGVSTPGSYKLSLVHAFGHGFSRDYDVHQGTIHGIVAPHVLRYLFENAYARRDLLAEALGVRTEGEGDEELAEAVIDAVTAVRDSLGLPARLRSVDSLDRDDLTDVAAAIEDDGLVATAPEGLDPTAEEIEAVLRRAW
jgi:alcohol dehydrogenase